MNASPCPTSSPQQKDLHLLQEAFPDHQSCPKAPYQNLCLPHASTPSPCASREDKKLLGLTGVNTPIQAHTLLLGTVAPFSTGDKYWLSEPVGKRGDLEAPHLPAPQLPVYKMGPTQKDTQRVLSTWQTVSTLKIWKVCSVWEEDQSHPQQPLKEANQATEVRY